MTHILRALAVLALLASSGFAQASPPAATDLTAPKDNFAGAQVGLTPTSHVTAGLNWGHHVTSTLWAFTRLDVVGFRRNPVQALTILTVGACDVPHALFGGHLLLGWCLDGGLAQTSDGTAVHIGNALGTDGLALWRFGKDGRMAAGVMGGWVQTNLNPANPQPGTANSALTPVRAVFEYNF